MRYGWRVKFLRSVWGTGYVSLKPDDSPKAPSFNLLSSFRSPHPPNPNDGSDSDQILDSKKFPASRVYINEVLVPPVYNINALTESPVPVRGGTFITALLLKHLFIDVDIPPVPGQESSCDMNLPARSVTLSSSNFRNKANLRVNVHMDVNKVCL